MFKDAFLFSVCNTCFFRWGGWVELKHSLFLLFSSKFMFNLLEMLGNSFPFGHPNLSCQNGRLSCICVFTRNVTRYVLKGLYTAVSHTIAKPLAHLRFFLSRSSKRNLITTQHLIKYHKRKNSLRMHSGNTSDLTWLNTNCEVYNLAATTKTFRKNEFLLNYWNLGSAH